MPQNKRYHTKKEIGQVRDLTREELEVLKGPRIKSPAIATLRDSHHRVARLFASGLRKHEVHMKCGYSLSRLGVLLADPGFMNLVASYRAQVDQSYRDSNDNYYDNANKLKIDVLEMIADQVEEAQETGEKIPLKTLVALNADLADRTGHGKKSTTVNVNVDLGSRLERARARASQVSIGQTRTPVREPLRLVDITPLQQRSPPIAGSLPRRRIIP